MSGKKDKLKAKQEESIEKEFGGSGPSLRDQFTSLLGVDKEGRAERAAARKKAKRKRAARLNKSKR